MRKIQELIQDATKTIAKLDKLLDTLTNEGIEVSLEIDGKDIPVTIKIKLPK